ncbi:hypothetical protein ACQ4PT_002914 [Festuca glaucescens]
MGTPEPDPQTLAAGELVWAKTKGRQHWWPARLTDACPAGAASKDAPVSCFGDDEPRPATRLRRFADRAADKMARASTARGFLNALELAHAAAVALLCTGLTCACASPAAPPAPAPAAAGAEDAVVVSGVANLSPSEFLASLRRAALDPPAVGLLDSAKLKSWTRALALGWGPAGAGPRYQRRSLEELADKIDLDDLTEPAEEEGDADAADEDSDKEFEMPPLKTPAQGKRKGRPRKDASLKEEESDAGEDADCQKNESGGGDVAALSTGRMRKKSKHLSDAGEGADDQKNESGGGTDVAPLSTGRMRKKSKYLSPPYTDLISSSVLHEKLADLPKESVPSARKEEKKAQQDNVDVGEVLELLHSLGVGFLHDTQLPKAAEGFLGSLRTSTFAGVDVAGLVSDPAAAVKLGKSVLERSRKKDDVAAARSSARRKKKIEAASPTDTLDFPAENAVAEDSAADVAALVSDSAAAPEQGKVVRKRGRKKKDQDESGTSSIKTKKKVEETSPKATPELPAENVSANASAEGTGLVPHSCATATEQGKAVSKRGRKKKDQDGSGTSPTKRKRMKKTSPTAILDSGLVITPAIPIRQVRAGDLISQLTSRSSAGMGVRVLDQNKLELKSPVPAAMSAGTKSGEEKDQADGGSVVETPVTVEATQPGTHTNVDNVVAGLAAKSVQGEETKAGMGIQVDMNVQSGIVDMPIASVQVEAMRLETNIPVDTNEQGVVTDVPVRSGLLPEDGGISQTADGNTNNADVEVSAVQGVVADVAVRSGFLPIHGGVSQPAYGYTNNGNVQVRAIQEPYPSLEAMMPEMYRKVDDIITGTNVTAMNHVFKAESQKGEPTSQQKTTGEAIANHAIAISSNGTCSDSPNSTPKRRNKKAPQYFSNPVEIVLQFSDGVILPSKEELLSAFSKFGILIEPLSGILEDIRGARVVFGKSAEADAVYARRETPGIFGLFGPPFATLKVLNYLPPFTPSVPAPAPPPALRPPIGVADMKKNVENMISSLAGKPAPPYLLGEMQRLLSKINNKQAGPSSSAMPPQ